MSSLPAILLVFQTSRFTHHSCCLFLALYSFSHFSCLLWSSPRCYLVKNRSQLCLHPLLIVALCRFIRLLSVCPPHRCTLPPRFDLLLFVYNVVSLLLFISPPLIATVNFFRFEYRSYSPFILLARLSDRFAFLASAMCTLTSVNLRFVELYLIFYRHLYCTLSIYAKSGLNGFTTTSKQFNLLSFIGEHRLHVSRHHLAGSGNSISCSGLVPDTLRSAGPMGGKGMYTMIFRLSCACPLSNDRPRPPSKLVNQPALITSSLNFQHPISASLMNVRGSVPLKRQLSWLDSSTR